MNISKEKRYDNLFMQSAVLSGNMSYCKRKQVGCVIVRDDRIVVNSWNGTVAGTTNDCEYDLDGRPKTKNTVVHAEANAILFAAKNGIKTEGAKIFVTLSPCIECSKMIIQAGIEEVIYKEDYRTEGKEFLEDCGIIVRKHI